MKDFLKKIIEDPFLMSDKSQIKKYGLQGDKDFVYRKMTLHFKVAIIFSVCFLLFTLTVIYFTN